MFQKDSRNPRRIAFFSALCLFLAAVEYAVPKPLPFMRIGLANLPIMLSLTAMSRRETAVLIGFKILAQGLLSGTFFSYVFVLSAGGSCAAGICMLAVAATIRAKKISYVGISVIGALANNAAQIALAAAILFGKNTRYIAPLLLVIGTASGTVLGFFTNAFCKKARWYAQLIEGEVSPSLQSPHSVPVFSATPSHGMPSAAAVKTAAPQPRHKKFRDYIEFTAALLCLPFFVLERDVRIIWVCVFVFFVAVLIKRRGAVNILPSFFVVLFVTVFALLSPSGKVLYEIGHFRITAGALLYGLKKSGTLVGMVFLSQFAISPRLALPGAAGAFLQNVFAYFDVLTAQRVPFKRGHIIEAIDEHLMEITQKLPL
ncbi:MAG: Gx transporter family protein [Treponema sp.]|nr:Gx transporter family protein [Treponema sp.]